MGKAWGKHGKSVGKAWEKFNDWSGRSEIETFCTNMGPYL